VSRRVPLRPAAVIVLMLLATVVVVAVPQSPASGTMPSKLTLEWIFGPGGRGVSAVPLHTWLVDGNVVLYDVRRPASERTLERLDPASGARRPLVDAARAGQNLGGLLGKGQAPVPLPWPAAIEGTGRRALYIVAGDVFVLDIESAAFTRLTSTASEETSPAFSPDGRRVSYVRDNDLYIFDLPAGLEVRVSHDGSETLLNGTLSWVYWEEIFGRRDIGYWWSPDSRSIAYLQTDQSPVEVSYFTDFAPSIPRVVRQRYPRAGTANPRVRVGVAEVGRPDARWVDIADRPFEYVVRLSWLPDSKRVSVATLTRDQERLDLYFAEAGTGAARHVLTETDPGWINITDDLHFLADNRHFLWASERDGFMHLYRYRLDGTPVNQVTRGEWALASSGSAYWVRQAVQGIDAAGNWIYVTAMADSSVERHLYRVHPDGTGFERVTKKPGTHRISMSPDARFYLDTFSDIRTLPSLALHRATGEEVRVVSPPMPEILAPFNVQYPELLTIPAEDGFPMPAQILKPACFKPNRRYPVVLYIYGGPSAPTVANAWQSQGLYNQLLLDEGYVVVQVDNRSATAISKRLENTILKQSGIPETADLVAAVRWLKRQPWVDAARVGVWGWSGGGTMTLNLLTRSREFKAGISVAPVTDWRYYDTKWAEAFMKRPQDNPEGYDRTSLVKLAAQLHGDLLIVYGTYDDNVHPQNEEAFADALVAAGKPFEMKVYPMRKHGIDDQPATIHLYRAMLDFWKRRL